MKKTITFQGKKFTLTGLARAEGMPAPDFDVVDGDLKTVNFSLFSSRIKILTSFPSLDTPVCEMQVKEFNKKASTLSENVVIIAVSKDLPFAQKRFCQAHGIRDIHVFSDYRSGSFGLRYGLLIRELGLLARSILLVDKNNVVRYIQIVDELTHAPDYEEALAKLENVLKNPALPQKPAAAKKLCEDREIKNQLVSLKGWEAIDGKLEKRFQKKTTQDARAFIDLIALLAEDENHLPDICWSGQTLTIALSTHHPAGITDMDLHMARNINVLSDL